jgi:hypothetical protein
MISNNFVIQQRQAMRDENLEARALAAVENSRQERKP